MRIIEIDPERRRLSLSLKRVTPAPAAEGDYSEVAATSYDEPAAADGFEAAADDAGADAVEGEYEG